MNIATLLRPSSVVVAAAALAAVATTAPAQAADMAGTFPLCYQSKAKPGAVTMALDLLVVAPAKTMSGDVTMGQATNPPLDVKLAVKGGYTNIAKDRHHAELVSPDMPGRHVKVMLTASKDWKAAIADYTLWLDTPAAPKTGKVALRMVPCTPAK